MKDNRFKLTALIALALLAIGVGFGAASQHSDRPTAEDVGAGDSAPPKTLSSEQGARFLDGIIRRWQQQARLTADIRWQVDLFGQSMEGRGQYTQIGQGHRQRHGIVLTGNDAANPIEFQQAVLASKRVVWTQWRTEIEQSASMIQLNELTSIEPEMPTAGIAHLLWRLKREYDFTSIQTVNKDSRQFWVLRGTRMKSSESDHSLISFLPADTNGIAILLDTKSGFPHRLRWEAIEGDKRDAVVTVDLINVSDQVSPHETLLQPKMFVPDAKDETDAYLQAIQLGAGGRH